jgi:protein-disulfide isomerase
MSQRDRRGDQGRSSARERLRHEREKQREASKRLRTLKVAGVGVLVLAVATLVGVLVVNNDGDGGGSADARPVVTGREHAPATLTVYEDFRCPACGQFENHFRSTIRGLEKKGSLKTRYHLVTIIDGNLGGSGSKRAANAALCAQDRKRFAAFHDALYENQPSEEKDSFASTSRLLDVARKVPGLNGNEDFAKCVRSNRNSGRVNASDAAFKKSGFQSTPTVLLDGKNIFGQGSRPLTPGALKRMVEKKA